MNSETILREIPGAVGVLVVLLVLGHGAMAVVIRALWARQNHLQDKLFDTQQDASQELLSCIEKTNRALSDNTAALASATTAMNASVAEIRRHG